MKKLMNGLINKLGKRSGQSLVEYTLVLALVVIVCIVALTTLGTKTSAKVASVATSLN